MFQFRKTFENQINSISRKKKKGYRKGHFRPGGVFEEPGPTLEEDFNKVRKGGTK